MKLKMVKHVYFKGTELQAIDRGFNVVTGYHKDLFLHINFNSSRVITFTPGKAIIDYDKFDGNEKLFINGMIQNGLAYIKEIGVRV